MIAATRFIAPSRDTLLAHAGLVVVFASPDAGLPRGARSADHAMRGALKRLVDSKAFRDLRPGAGTVIPYPAGMGAEKLLVIRWPARVTVADARAAGNKIGATLGEADALIAAPTHHLDALVESALLRGYTYGAQKSRPAPSLGRVDVMVADPDSAEAGCRDAIALAEAVHLTRDLVNAPANILTTTSFADQIAAMAGSGLQVEIMDEDALEALDMRALLAVGRGSECPTRMVVMRWMGAGDDTAPLAVLGKGVMFDAGGISLKPGAGMEEMTMDMGGAAVTVGLMHALAARRAKANVVGIVGLVENMPDGRAQRPGDVIRARSGTTIEVINTDAEGRLVLADLISYAQDIVKPAAMVDLATLTGAIIVALGHEKAGVFGNDDAFAADFLKAADSVGEGAWRMPLGKRYADLLKSRIADIKNTGGRPAGSITAAEFLHHFVANDMPWLHLDIAGVTLTKTASTHAPRGASGWGVRALDALVRARFERA